MMISNLNQLSDQQLIEACRVLRPLSFAEVLDIDNGEWVVVDFSFVEKLVEAEGL